MTTAAQALCADVGGVRVLLSVYEAASHLSDHHKLKIAYSAAELTSIIYTVCIVHPCGSVAD